MRLPPSLPMMSEHRQVNQSPSRSQLVTSHPVDTRGSEAPHDLRSSRMRARLLIAEISGADISHYLIHSGPSSESHDVVLAPVVMPHLSASPSLAAFS